MRTTAELLRQIQRERDANVSWAWRHPARETFVRKSQRKESKALDRSLLVALAITRQHSAGSAFSRSES